MLLTALLLVFVAWAVLQVIRDMIADMGSPGSLPRDDKDVIDMMSVLQELTFSSAERQGEHCV